MSEIMKKVCMCGDPAVGKTSLIKRFVTGRYDEKYISTLGTVVNKKSLNLNGSENTITMMIWDISGQSEFKRIHAAAFKNAAGGLAVCDATRPETADSIGIWVKNLREQNGWDVPVVVLVNKTDMLKEDDPRLAAVRRSVGRLGASVLLTSAKTGTNVEDAFKNIGRTMIGASEKASVKAPESPKPEKMDTPQSFLDYVIDRFCRELGDEQLGMSMIRKQVNDLGMDIDRPNQMNMTELNQRLSNILKESKGEKEARQFRMHIMASMKNCKW